jgi:hypothetical protein
MKPRPVKGLGRGIRAIAPLYLSVVPFATYLCKFKRLGAHIALRCQRARASRSWLGQRLFGKHPGTSLSYRIRPLAHYITAAPL